MVAKCCQSHIWPPGRFDRDLNKYPRPPSPQTVCVPFGTFLPITNWLDLFPGTSGPGWLTFFAVICMPCPMLEFLARSWQWTNLLVKSGGVEIHVPGEMALAINLPLMPPPPLTAGGSSENGLWPVGKMCPPTYVGMCYGRSRVHLTYHVWGFRVLSTWW